MKLTKLLSSAAALSIIGSNAIFADTIIINPSDDGVVFVLPWGPPYPVNNWVLYVDHKNTQAIVRFPTAQISGPVSQAFLTVNLHDLGPLWDPTVDVYGITDGGASISGSDANAGTFLGTIDLSN